MLPLRFDMLIETHTRNDHHHLRMESIPPPGREYNWTHLLYGTPRLQEEDFRDMDVCVCVWVSRARSGHLYKYESH